MPDPYHPYQQYQNQYQDPRFGQSHDEGTIEEHIHRSVNKRVDHSRTPGQPGDRGRLLIATSATALVAVVAAAVTLAMFLVYKGSAETQLSQMRQQLAAMGQQFQNAQNANASSYGRLSGKVNAMSAAVGTITQYNITCAQALESQAGPGTYYFPCSATRPLFHESC
jgi:hypothetical protein